MADDNKIEVLFLNANGAGFADTKKIPAGMTISDFMAQYCPDLSPSNALIRVNRQPVSANQVLNDRDRITVTPTKIEGAC